MDGSAYRDRSKLDTLLGPILPDLRGKTVVDFGCGHGDEAAELAERGAVVKGIDIRDDILAEARRRQPRLWFGKIDELDAQADYVVSLDSFEHFAQPAEILGEMARILKPGGAVLTCFGPTWYHPLGGHLFSVFPWAHLVFSERALMDWRSGIRDDGAKTFAELPGGLNRMTIRRFERIVEASSFSLEMQCVPIRRTARLHNRVTREFLTAVIRAKLTL